MAGNGLTPPPQKEDCLTLIPTDDSSGYDPSSFIDTRIAEREDYKCALCNKVAKDICRLLCEFDEGGKDLHDETYCENCLRKALANSGGKCVNSGCTKPAKRRPVPHHRVRKKIINAAVRCNYAAIPPTSRQFSVSTLFSHGPEQSSFGWNVRMYHFLSFFFAHTDLGNR